MPKTLPLNLHKSLDFSLSQLSLRAAAIGLVMASAGLSASYSWMISSPRGWFFGVLMCVCVICLECVKPQAFRQCLTSFAKIDLVRGGGLLLLALVASAFSLQCELSSLSTFRADTTGARAVVATQHANAQADLDVARSSLVALGVVKPVAEVDQAFSSIKFNPTWDKTKGCTDATLTASRAFCANATKLAADYQLAKKAEELRAKIETAETTLAANATVTDADPGAASVVNLLASTGWKVDSATVGSVFILVSILAIEFGSLFAGLLTGEEANTLRLPAPTSEPSVIGVEHDRTLATVSPSQTPVNPPDHAPDQTEHSIAGRILSRLRVSADGLVATTRALAADLGCSNSTVCDAIAKLQSRGLVRRVANSRGRGSALRLVSAQFAG